MKEKKSMGLSFYSVNIFFILSGYVPIHFILKNVIPSSSNRSLSSPKNIFLTDRHIENLFKRGIEPFTNGSAGFEVHTSHIKIGIAVINNCRCILASIHAFEL